MFASIPETESAVRDLMCQGRMNDALANILVGVHNHCRDPNVARHFLYYDQLDALMVELARAVLESVRMPESSYVGANTLVVASDMYDVGGHSRVIADLVHEVPSPVIVLTDMFWLSRKSPDRLNWLYETLPDVPVIVLPQLNLWEKCRGLCQLTQRINPKHIFYFNHHEDPIPFVGTLSHLGSRKTLVHHCDHNPSLGNTLPGVEHLDFTENVAVTCAHFLKRSTCVLPLYVEDSGRRPNRKYEHCSVVSSGADHKYVRTGPLAYQNIVRTVLETVDGNFFHIGRIDGQWIDEIKAHLQFSGLSPHRFVSLGSVPSLWKELAALDAQIYLASAPVGGGRAAIEAQGCGYPVAFFRVQGQGPALEAESLFADRSLGWADLAELPVVLAHARENLMVLEEQARMHYERYFSHARFAEVLSNWLA